MSNKQIKVLFVPTLGTSICWWRAENFAQTMVSFKKRCMINVYYPTNPNDSPHIAWDAIIDKGGELPELIRQTMEAGFQFFDVIILQRLQYMPGLEFIKEMKDKYPNVKVVMEIDDSVGEVTPSNFHIDKFIQHMTISAFQSDLSDAIITSTPYLRNSLIDKPREDELIKTTPSEKLKNIPIHVAENCINFSDWNHDQDAPVKNTELKRIVYVAGGGHDEDLMIAYKSLLELRKRFVGFNFVVRYGGFRPEWLVGDWIDFKLVGWHISTYPQELKNLNADLAIAPLRDTEFNRCKSNIKWQEWASLGVPLVASNIEPYKNTRGFIILSSNDHKEFADNIEIGLEVDEDLKKGLVKQVKSLYDIRRESGSLLTFLKSLIK